MCVCVCVCVCVFFFFASGVFADQKAEVADLLEEGMQKSTGRTGQRTDFVGEKCSRASRRLEREEGGRPVISWVCAFLGRISPMAR